MIPRRERTRATSLLFLPLLLLILAIGGSALVLRAQAPVTSPQPLTAATELVFVDASVLDNKGNFVGGLTDRNFRIFDNGEPRPIAIFDPVELPAKVLVIMETSPAVYLVHDEHLAAAYSLLDGLAVDDQVALVAYDQSPRMTLGFTTDKSALLAALNEVQYTIGMGDLNFYDSVSTALDWIGRSQGKQALVILTTGLDSSPPAHWDALVRKLRSDYVVIYSVALGGAIRPGESSKKTKKTAPAQSAADAGFAKADQTLRSLATITGGRAYFPRSEKDFAPIYHEIASALRHQYVLGIVPAHDGQFHALTVEPLGANGQPMNAPSKKPAVRVFAREGYLAPGP